MEVFKPGKAGDDGRDEVGDDGDVLLVIELMGNVEYPRRNRTALSDKW